MANETKILDILTEVQTMAPAGYAMALHIRFAAPTILLQTYPKTWTDYYSQNGLVMSDPTVGWGFENEGSQRWSALDDPAGVMARAAEHGLAYGVTCALDIDDSRTLCSFARADREFTDAEMARFQDQIGQLHQLTRDLSAFSAECIKKLLEMSVRVEQPAH